jgi:hypothetical protein
MDKPGSLHLMVSAVSSPAGKQMPNASIFMVLGDRVPCHKSIAA